MGDLSGLTTLEMEKVIDRWMCLTVQRAASFSSLWVALSGFNVLIIYDLPVGERWCVCVIMYVAGGSWGLLLRKVKNEREIDLLTYFLEVTVGMKRVKTS